jgi:ParB family chromosome partitioning protein
MDQLGLTQAELASRLGEERSSIANFLRLLELAEPVKNMVRDGRLSLGHAKLLAGVADILEQERLAQTVVAQSLSVRNLERLLENGPPAKSRRRHMSAIPSC